MAELERERRARKARYGPRGAAGASEEHAAQWLDERTAVLRALEGFPEARAEVIRELEAACKRLRS